MAKLTPVRPAAQVPGPRGYDMASDPIVANRRLASFVTACAAALVLAGCQTTGPPRDPAILSGIPEAKANASALFTSLQQPPPACTASANAAGFGKVESNLGGLKSVSYTHLTLPTNREV